MKKEELIKKLEQLPAGAEVCIFDFRKAINEDWGDGTSAGVYSDFAVELIDFTADEKEFIEESSGKKFKAWIGLNFDNVDYTDDGRLVDDVEPIENFKP